MIQKNILIREDQEQFIKAQRLGFNFSKLVRAKLDEYIKMINKIENEA